MPCCKSGASLQNTRYSCARVVMAWLVIGDTSLPDWHCTGTCTWLVVALTGVMPCRHWLSDWKVAACMHCYKQDACTAIGHCMKHWLQTTDVLPPAIKTDDQGYCNWCPCSCKLHTSPTNCPCSSQDILQASGVRPHVLQCIQNRLAGYCAGYIACMYCCKLLTAMFLSSFQLRGFICHDCRSRYSLRDVCQCTSKHSAA